MNNDSYNSSFAGLVAFILLFAVTGEAVLRGFLRFCTIEVRHWQLLIPDCLCRDVCGVNRARRER